MNESETEDPKPGGSVDPLVPVETADKPKRRRSVRQAALAPEPVPAPAPQSSSDTRPEAAVGERPEAAAEIAAPAAGVDAPAPARAKPVRRRRTAAAAVPGPVQEPVDGPHPVTQAQPWAEPMPAAPTLADPPVQTESTLAAAEVAATEIPSADGTQLQAAAAESDGLADAGLDASTPREGARRRRNRRRNRDRDRAVATAAGGEDDAPAAMPSTPDVAPRLLPPTDPAELFAEVLSGAFDSEPQPDPAAGELAGAEPARRVLAAEPDAPKLHKVLAQSGVGSRRDMEQWVIEGRVTVNGEPAHTGQRISFGDRIAVDGKPVKVRIAPPPPRVLAYHKPVGEVVTHGDPQHRPTVFRRLPRLPHGKWQSVGRLDINTEGLLLFTNSGELANQLMHPRFGVEREYAVRSLGVLDDEQRERLLEGVEIDGQRAAFKSVEDGGGEGVNHWYRVVITEGRNREVRRLFEAVGHAVSRLIRIRYGCVVLPRGLKRGVWVDLPEGDVKALRRLTGTDRDRDRPRDADGPPGGRNKRGRRGGRSRDNRPRDIGAGRPPRADRADEAVHDSDVPMHIPNPLQQTYDKRFIQQARAQRRELSEDDPIPNPLQQTYDRRALQRDRLAPRELPEDGPIPNPLQQTYDKRFVGKGGSPATRGARERGAGGGASGGRQPDPMQTSVGYIGADALQRKRAKGGRGGRKTGGGHRTGGGGGRSR